MWLLRWKDEADYRCTVELYNNEDVALAAGVDNYPGECEYDDLSRDERIALFRKQRIYPNDEDGCWYYTIEEIDVIDNVSDTLMFQLQDNKAILSTPKGCIKIANDALLEICQVTLAHILPNRDYTNVTNINKLVKTIQRKCQS